MSSNVNQCESIMLLFFQAQAKCLCLQYIFFIFMAGKLGVNPTEYETKERYVRDTEVSGFTGFTGGLPAPF